MLDVIITVSESTPQNFVAECRSTVREAGKLTPFPVNIIEVPGVPGHIGQAMANGFAKSTAPYVAWVDDDDFVLPNAFSCLARHFDAQPSGIFAREIKLLANGRLVPTEYRHHLAVYRRDIVESVPLATLVATPNVDLHNAARDGVDELSWVYVRRIRRSGGMALRRLQGMK